MKWKLIVILLIAFILLAGCMAPTAPMRGIPGAKGDSGASTIDVNYTFTGAPGTGALVVNVGNITDAMLDFTIPRGTDGINNMTAGPQGIQGPQGIPGTDATPVVNGSLTSTNPVALSAARFVIGGDANIFLRNDQALTINTISTDPALSTSNYSISTSSAVKNYVDGKTLPSLWMNQTPNMTPGPTGATGGSGGQILYFDHLKSTDPITYEILNLIPAGNAEADETVTVKNGLGEVLVDPYVTNIGYPALTEIPAGLWRFRTFHYVSGASGTTTAVFKVYNRTATGTETLLFTATSDDIDATIVNEYLTSYVTTTTYKVSSTDRIVCKVYGQSTHSSNIIFHFVYDGTTHTSHIQSPLDISPATTLTFSAVAGETLKKGQAVYISGTSGSDPLISLADNTATAKSRVVGLVTTDISSGGKGQVRRSGILTAVNTQATNLAVNPSAETWVAGDLLFATTSGGMTKNRPTSGRSVKSSYSLIGSNANDVLLAYPMENPVWVTAASGENVVLRMGDDLGATSISIRNYSNYQVAYIDSLGNINSTKALSGTKTYYVSDTSGGVVNRRLTFINGLLVSET
jgi:hypothetical protein